MTEVASGQPSGATAAHGWSAARATGAGRVRSRLRVSQYVALAGVVLCLMVASTGALLVAQLRSRAFVDTERELSNMSLVLANSVENSLRSAELLQKGILERLATLGIDSLDTFDTRLAERDVYEDLKARIAALPQVEAMFLSDEKGRTIASSRAWPFPTAFISDRTYFLELRDHPTRSAYLGEPNRNQITGTSNLYLSRRVEKPNGGFLGIAVVALDRDYFERFLGSLALGSGSSVALLRQDGILLARQPRVDGAIGASQAGGALVRRLQAEAGPFTIQASSTLDGQSKIISARPLTDYPVIVVVTRTLTESLAGWRQQAYYIVGATALLVAVTLGMALVGARQIRSRTLLDEAQSQLALARERDLAERDRRVQHGRLEAAVASMSQGLCMFGSDGRVVMSNDRFGLLLDLATEACGPGTLATELHDAVLQRRSVPSDCAADLAQQPAPDGAGAALPSRLHVLRDGRSVLLGRAAMVGGGWLVTLEDVTEQRQAEAQIEHMAYHDQLTSLPNRAMFHVRLEEAFLQARRSHPAALLFLDLDRFKEVNDTFGHPAGDELLRVVADRIRSEVRDNDTVARLGGDEFAVIQTDLVWPGDVAALAKRLINALSAPFDLDGQLVGIGTSVGIALLPDDGTDADLLLRNADLALYRAKEEGRGSYRFFEPEMDLRMQLRRVLDVDLRQALVRGEFEVHYQPIVELASGQVTCLEALLRWRHPQRGLVSPDRFIPIAEENGLIAPIGSWVLTTACLEAARWPGRVAVAVNLSSVQFNGDLTRVVAEALQKSGFDPSRLELEITETVMLKDTEATLTTLHELKALGISIALDDFGTGFSSLSYLQRFPFNRVKVDRSFVHRMCDSRESAAIVRAISGLCASLDMDVTAEGVETGRQWDELAAIGCSHAQGFLISKPRCATDVPSLLCAGMPLPAV